MTIPLHTTLRFAGIGILAGMLLGMALGLAFVHLGVVGFYGVSLTLGFGAIAASHILERRARRASNEGETK